MTRSRRGTLQQSAVLKQLQVGRGGAIQVMREAKIKSDEYRAARDLTDTIDVLVEKLTGDKTYFHEKGSGYQVSGKANEWLND